MAYTLGEASILLSANTRPLQNSLARVGSMVSRALAPLAAAVGGVGLGMLTRSAMQSTDALAKTADMLGLTTQGLAGLHHAAGLAGMSTQQMDMSLQRMTRRLAEAAQGTGAAQDAIKELGLDAQQLARMQPDEALRMIADAMDGIDGQSDKVRIAFKLFDSEGVKMVNALRGGAGALDAASDEAERFGLAISRADAAKIEQANDAIFRMRQAMRGLGTQMAIALSPHITAAANAFAEMVPRMIAGARRISEGLRPITAMLGQVAAYVLDVGRSVLRMAANAVRGIGRWIGENRQLITSLAVLTGSVVGLTVAWRGVGVAINMARTAAIKMWAAMLGPITLVVAGIAAIGAAIAYHIGEGETIVERLRSGFVRMATWVVTAGVGAFTAVEVAIRNWRTTLEIAMKTAQLSLASLWEGFKHLFRVAIPSVMSWFGRNWSTLLTDMARLAGTMLENLFHNVTLAMRKIWDFLTGIDWAGVWHGFKQASAGALTKVSIAWAKRFVEIAWMIQNPLLYAARFLARWALGSGKRVAENMSAIWKDPDKFEFKGLTDGFKWKAKKFPDILRRTMSGRERELLGEIGELAGKLGSEFSDKFGPRVQAALAALGLVTSEADAAAVEIDEKLDDAMESRKAEHEIELSERRKIEFVGLEDMWKRIAGSIAGNDDPDKQTARNTQRTAEAAERQTRHAEKSVTTIESIVGVLERIEGRLDRLGAYGA